MVYCTGSRGVVAFRPGLIDVWDCCTVVNRFSIWVRSCFYFRKSKAVNMVNISINGVILWLSVTVWCLYCSYIFWCNVTNLCIANKQAICRLHVEARSISKWPEYPLLTTGRNHIAIWNRVLNASIIPASNSGMSNRSLDPGNRSPGLQLCTVWHGANASLLSPIDSRKMSGFTERCNLPLTNHFLSCFSYFYRRSGN